MLRALTSILLLVLCGLANASGPVGREWTSMSFTTSDDHKVSLELERPSIIHVTLDTPDCKLRDEKIDTEGYAALNRVAFSYDDYDDERVYMLHVPVIELHGEKQVHFDKTFVIRNCKITKGQVIELDSFPS
jgi:hypothetical protein